jgi:glycosyltransferase involved in cell wall biosynthesis
MGRFEMGADSMAAPKRPIQGLGVSGGIPRGMIFMAGRDPRHPQAGGGDIQAWAWATWVARQGARVVFVCQSHPSLGRSDFYDGVEVLRLGGGLRLSWRAFRYFCQHRSEFEMVYEDPIGSGRMPFLTPLYSNAATVAVWHQVSAELLQEIYGTEVAAVLSFLERLLARVYKSAFLWVPSAERAAEVVQALRFNPDRVRVIPPTIPKDSLSTRPYAERAPIILFLGVIRPYKAIHHLVEAFPAVLSREPQARLVIAGRRMDRSYETRLRDLVARLDLDGSVEFALDVKEDKKVALLREARVLVLPSRLEGFGIVTLEANAAGTPIVASSGVPRAAVEHEVNGLRYAYGDRGQLEAALIRILGDPSLHRALSETGRERAAGFVPEVVGREFGLLLLEVVRCRDAGDEHRRPSSKDFGVEGGLR